MDASRLINEYKRTGRFDKKRRELLGSFEQSDSDNAQLEQLLTRLLDLKAETDASMLAEKRGRLVALVEAALSGRQQGWQQGRQQGSGSGIDGKSRRQRRVSDPANGSQRTDSDNAVDEEAALISQIDRLLDKYVARAVAQDAGVAKEVERELASIE